MEIVWQMLFQAVWKMEIYQSDGYTKYLMPVLLLLIFTLVLVGIFDSIRMDIRRKYDYYGTLLRLGMNSKKIALFYSMEMLIVLAVTILAGIFCGKWGYEFLISLANVY